jgi:hypothetical protein
VSQRAYNEDMAATPLPTTGHQAREAVPMTSITFNEACDHVAMNFEATKGFIAGGTYMVCLDNGNVAEIEFRMGDSGIVRPVR